MATKKKTTTAEIPETTTTTYTEEYIPVAIKASTRRECIKKGEYVVIQHRYDLRRPIYEFVASSDAFIRVKRTGILYSPSVYGLSTSMIDPEKGNEDVIPLCNVNNVEILAVDDFKKTEKEARKGK